MNHSQPTNESLYSVRTLIQEASSFKLSFLTFLILFTYSIDLSGQLQNSCDPIFECHNYFGTTIQSEMVPCTYCSTCTQDCFTELPSTTDPIIYSFVALSSFISIDVSLDPNNILDFVVKLTDEYIETCYETVSHCLTGQPEFTMEVDDLIVGRKYNIIFYSCFFIDTPGNDLGEFEFTFNEDPGNYINIIERFETAPEDNCRQSTPEEWPLCTGDKLRIWPIFNEGFDPSFFNGSIWEFTYYSSEITETISVEYTSGYLDILFEQEGEYSIFFNRIIDFECSEIFDIEEQLVREKIVVVDDPIVLDETYRFCQKNFENGFTPPSPWTGGIITEPGTYINLLTDECECDPYQRVEIISIELVVGEISLELCPQDLPYIVTEDIVINVGDDLDGTYYEIENGSLQEGYFQEYCDSLVQIFVTFVDDPDVCNECELAYSVKLDNLIACIPFDNSELDVSLHDNHSDLINGAEFFEDRFGTPNFATNLDGVNDYIRIDHTEEFLVEQYSLSFWFNKTENTFTDSNPKEALIHKGLEGASNKSFSITLEEHFTDRMLLDFRINSGSFEKNIRYGALEYDRWYHVAVINDFGNLKLIIDGQVVESNNGNVSEKFNGEDLLIGVIPSSSGFSGFFKGQIDEFRFWRRTLTDLEGYLLYRPEAEFHVTEEYFLSCCESVQYHGQEYDINTVVDTIRIIGASPNGKDSLYIININPNDQAPVINEDLIPEDVFVEINTICDELCSTTVEWEDPPMDAFVDNCSNLTVTQSHYSPLTVNGDEDVINVVYTAVDDCGQETQASFTVNIQCTNTSSPEIPEPSMLVPLANNICVEEENYVCPGTEISWSLLQTNDVNQNPSIYPANFIADWVYILSTPDGLDTITYINSPSPSILYLTSLDGSYELCLQSISNLCYQSSKIVCQSFNVAAPPDVDHGSINICNSDLESLNDLYPDISQELVSLIQEQPFGESHIIMQIDECDCAYNEMVNINIVNDYAPEEVILNICPEDIPFIYNGLIINESDNYDQEVIILPGLSLAHNDFGESCDSIVILTANVIPQLINSPIQVEICEGEEYLGFTEQGIYEIVHSGSNGCDSIVTIDLTVLPNDDPNCKPTAVQKSPTSDIKLYPIPSSYFIILESDMLLNDVLLAYHILSIDGSIVLEGKISKEENNVIINKLESGVYIFRLITNDRPYSLKFVVSR